MTFGLAPHLFVMGQPAPEHTAPNTTQTSPQIQLLMDKRKTFLLRNLSLPQLHQLTLALSAYLFQNSPLQKLSKQTWLDRKQRLLLASWWVNVCGLTSANQSQHFPREADEWKRVAVGGRAARACGGLPPSA